MGRSAAEWEQHIQFVQDALDQREPTVAHLMNELGVWDEDRLTQQRELIDYLWSAGTANVARGGDAVIAGGVPGAGKSTVLFGPAGIVRSEYLTVNPDIVKEAMADRGMIPNVDGLSPMEASELVHKEASELAYQLATMASEARVNLVWDITMDSTTSVTRRIEELRNANYLAVDAVFVDTPIDEAVDRVMKRYRDDQDDYDTNGRGWGGRFVPQTYLDGRRTELPEYSSLNQQVFYEVRGDFDSTIEYDNSNTEAKPRSVTGTRWASST